MTLAVGDRAQQTFHVDEGALEHFAAACGDRNPVHFDEAFAASSPFGGRVAHGMLTASYLSTVLGMQLPGPGTIYVGQTLRFRGPVRPGVHVRCEVEVTAYDPARRRATLDTRAFVGDALVLEGEATVIAPA